MAYNIGVANFVCTWFSTWQWSDLPVCPPHQVHIRYSPLSSFPFEDIVCCACEDWVCPTCFCICMHFIQSCSLHKPFSTSFGIISTLKNLTHLRGTSFNLQHHPIIENAKEDNAFKSLWCLLQVHTIDGHLIYTHLPNELGGFFKLIHAYMLRDTKQVYGRSTIISYQRKVNPKLSTMSSCPRCGEFPSIVSGNCFNNSQLLKVYVTK